MSTGLCQTTDVEMQSVKVDGQRRVAMGGTVCMVEPQLLVIYNLEAKDVWQFSFSAVIKNRRSVPRTTALQTRQRDRLGDVTRTTLGPNCCLPFTFHGAQNSISDNNSLSAASRVDASAENNATRAERVSERRWLPTPLIVCAF